MAAVDLCQSNRCHRCRARPPSSLPAALLSCCSSPACCSTHRSQQLCCCWPLPMQKSTQPSPAQPPAGPPPCGRALPIAAPPRQPIAPSPAQPGTTHPPAGLQPCGTATQRCAPCRRCPGGPPSGFPPHATPATRGWSHRVVSVVVGVVKRASEQSRRSSLKISTT